MELTVSDLPALREHVIGVCVITGGVVSGSTIGGGLAPCPTRVSRETDDTAVAHAVRQKTRDRSRVSPWDGAWRAIAKGSSACAAT